MYAGKSGFNSDNIVIQQETTEAINELEKSVISDREKLNISTQQNFASMERPEHWRSLSMPCNHICKTISSETPTATVTEMETATETAMAM